MIDVKKYEEDLINLGGQYFIRDIQYVTDLMLWAKETEHGMDEPYSAMKLIANPDNTLSMMLQREISDDMLNGVIRNLGIRWSLRDNVTNIESKLNSVKKRLVYCYLKERARSMKDVGGNDQVEDQWVIDEMEILGYFEE
jgi:hypothetical protein